MKEYLKVLLIYLASLSSIYSQTSGGFYGDCGEHTFRITHTDSLGYSDYMYVERNNDCPSEQELVLDFYFWSVPDKITVFDHEDNMIMETGFVGSYWYQPCTQGPITVGYAEYHNNKRVIQNGFPPLDFMVHPNPNAIINKDGLGRIKIKTDSHRLKIVWTASVCGPTYTDMFVRCSPFILETYHNSTYTEFLCEESETYQDTVFSDCGYDVFQGLYGQTQATKDTICGLYGQYIAYRNTQYRITQDDIVYLEETNEHGCERVDTLVILLESLYIPNVATELYYLGPKIEFDIFDQWGNHIFRGDEWWCRDMKPDVYVVRADYKGKEFINTVTVIR